MPFRILVADDNQDTIGLLEVMLRPSGWQVSGATSLAEARKQIDTGSFDMVILDSWLPDGDGVDLCRELRSSNPYLPILFLSGAAFPADIDGATEAGCNAYLVKPCKMDELTAVIQSLIAVNPARHAVS